MRLSVVGFCFYFHFYLFIFSHLVIFKGESETLIKHSSQRWVAPFDKQGHTAQELGTGSDFRNQEWDHPQVWLAWLSNRNHQDDSNKVSTLTLLQAAFILSHCLSTFLPSPLNTSKEMSFAAYAEGG